MPFFKTHAYALPRSRILENSAKRNGLRHTIFNTAGDKYVGEWKDDRKNGKGVILTRNNELYEGDMVNNCRHGFGVLAQRIPNTDVFRLCYRGDWKNGRMHGDGLRVYPDGSFYIGEFKNGKRNGHGQQWYPDEAFFDGYYKDDLRNGLGMFVRADGNRYEGEWQNDLKHGKGFYLHLHSGQWQEGVWHLDMCVYSQMKDLYFRQSAIRPTPFPIPRVTLKYTEKVCDTANRRALGGFLDTCEDEDFITYDDSYNGSKGSLIYPGNDANKI